MHTAKVLFKFFMFLSLWLFMTNKACKISKKLALKKPDSQSRHNGWATADKWKMSYLIAEDNYHLRELIEANRIHCKVRLRWKDISDLRFTLKKDEDRKHWE